VKRTQDYYENTTGGHTAITIITW